MSNVSVAFLGLGQMGRRMAQRLSQAGIHIRVYNRTPRPELERGAPAHRIACVSPAEAIAGASIVLTMLRDDDAVDELWAMNDVRAALRADQLVIDCTTQSPLHARKMQRDLSQLCRGYFECPVLGTTPAAETGQLVGLVSGTYELPPNAVALLGHCVVRTIQLGGPGNAALYKLAVNSWLAQQVAALSQLFRSVEGSGIAAEHLWELLADSPLTSAAARGAGQMMIDRRFDPQFPIELVVKDLRYFAQSFQELELARASRLAYEACLAQGLGGANLTAIVQRSYGDDERAMNEVNHAE